ncbi:hypothetical protein CORT_0G04440 [Candida orthopsilosis Co 90-125]|uniref:Uncharacterized protein n=1 Tax=Candida orthopsilosis (strain 90-125) TaxID=1136231 RepID=H8XAE4_CANO9|nr:hypothetical protein CORT_0G04440 [Candida orthopsilosis Co 90-125]CCG25121.1 hypothetical protein CORT_0G04440 [Candida orthopsilosis Co 90-125]
MSLFRTLQSSPATVTLFHNSRIPLSNELYKILNKTYDSLPEKPKYDFQIDLMKNQMPTYEQYQIFVNKFLKTDQAKKTLHDSFPFLNERSTDLLDSHGKKVTIKGIDWSNKVFSQSEYQKIYDTFNKLVENENDHSVDTNPAQIFKAPLVVDWDQDLLAGDQETLKALLAKYVDQ